mgnify:CR=1 FL=1
MRTTLEEDLAVQARDDLAAVPEEERVVRGLGEEAADAEALDGRDIAGDRRRLDILRAKCRLAKKCVVVSAYAAGKGDANGASGERGGHGLRVVGAARGRMEARDQRHVTLGAG